VRGEQWLHPGVGAGRTGRQQSRGRRTPSYIDNGDGYLLTADSMRWFWDHYADPALRSDPMASPLRADDLANLPPAMVVTCEFDPLRDEGIAYAEAMEAAGVLVRQLQCRGHIHTSMTAVGMVISSTSARAEMGGWLRHRRRQCRC
jgi:acetyl esterase/lipase